MNVAAHPWMPVSPCGDRCLPPAGAVPAAGRGRQVLRITATAATVLAGTILAAMLPLLRPVDRERVLRAWFRALLAALQIRLAVTGSDRFGPRGAGVLVVSNHMSWLDLVALGAVQPLRMVAKREVRDWPVVGLLARRAGTIFVHRERLSALPRTIAAVSDALHQGAAVGVFPEGTTWCGMASGRFRPAMFQAAAQTGTPVRPVALRYRLTSRTAGPAGAGSAGAGSAGAGSAAAGSAAAGSAAAGSAAAGSAGAGSAGAGPTTTVTAFVGSTTLLRAVVVLAGVRGLVIEVRLLPMLSADGADRRLLAARADAAVTAASAPLVPAVALVTRPELGPVTPAPRALPSRC